MKCLTSSTSYRSHKGYVKSVLLITLNLTASGLNRRARQTDLVTVSHSLAI